MQSLSNRRDTFLLLLSVSHTSIIRGICPPPNTHDTHVTIESCCTSNRNSLYLIQIPKVNTFLDIYINRKGVSSSNVFPYTMDKAGTGKGDSEYANLIYNLP